MIVPSIPAIAGKRSLGYFQVVRSHKVATLMSPHLSDLQLLSAIKL